MPAPDDDRVPGLADLPEAVRGRVLALAAEVLPAVPRLPAPLARVAEFAPARRARLGASAIGAALESDDDLRDRVAVQVRAGDADADADGEGGGPGTDATHDPVRSAARAWLLRPPGWEAVLAAAVTRIGERSAAESPPQEDRWRSRVRAAEQALREARERHREELAEARAENSRLRRRLGETRAQLRDASAAAERTVAEAEQARRAAEAELAAREKELRRLRGRVEAFEAQEQRQRRSARAEREDATLRARLLLDTVVDAATGLRRELSLPSVPGSPGERAEAGLAGGDQDAGTGSSTPALAPTSPAVLEQLLALPRSRLLVDGYNVTMAAWPSSSLEAQRTRLLNALAPLVARTGAETTVVFDAASSGARPVVGAPRGVRVAFSPVGVIADDVIRELAAAEPAGRVVVVVTSDQAVARDVARGGARAVAADALLPLL